MIADCRCINPKCRVCLRQVKLGFSRQAMANLLPVGQIAAVKDRHSRKILERGSDNIIVASTSGNAGVRIHPGQNWILVCVIHRYLLLSYHFFVCCRCPDHMMHIVC